jgi:hypothetical protein
LLNGRSPSASSHGSPARKRLLCFGFLGLDNRNIRSRISHHASRLSVFIKLSQRALSYGLAGRLILGTIDQDSFTKTQETAQTLPLKLLL